MNRLRTLSDPTHLPAFDPAYAHSQPALGLGPLEHRPRILLLYGSLRDRSFSRLAVEEAARLLEYFGAETRIFDPSDLPLPDQVKGDDHPAVRELREHSIWSEGQVWCSPERHGQITGIMKPSAYYDRIVDVMEELVRFTVLLRPHADRLVDRYSERREAEKPVDTTADLATLAVGGGPGRAS